MKISIIIPTYNRNTILCNTLKSILSFKHQFDELLLIDQTKEHDEETKKYLDSLVSKNKITYIFEEKPSTPNAKNIGIERSTGDILFFFDDDVEINEDTIISNLEILKNEDIGGVTGRVIIQNTDISGNIVLGNTVKAKNPLKSLIFFFLRKKASYVGLLGIISDFTGNKLLPTDTCIGCNMAFKKETLQKSGFFDTNFTGNAVREETDLSVRIRKAGYKIFYNPNASVIHYMNNSGGTRTEANEQYWYSLFKNQSYFYYKNFKFSFIHIYFLQFFDILRCKKTGLKPSLIFKKAFNEAKGLIN